MAIERKLEIGCGERPTPGYVHNDIAPFKGVDIVGRATEIGLPNESLDEVLALGVMEHLNYTDVATVLKKAHGWLVRGGVLLFDVPNLPAWCRYLVDLNDGKKVPFKREHIISTLYGWQRWEGDEHRSGWDTSRMIGALSTAGYENFEISQTPEEFTSRGHFRRRMSRPEDAHLYVKATK